MHHDHHRIHASPRIALITRVTGIPSIVPSDTDGVVDDGHYRVGAGPFAVDRAPPHHRVDPPGRVVVEVDQDILALEAAMEGILGGVASRSLRHHDVGRTAAGGGNYGEEQECSRDRSSEAKLHHPSEYGTCAAVTGSRGTAAI
jgi:hypothetical protein